MSAAGREAMGAYHERQISTQKGDMDMASLSDTTKDFETLRGMAGALNAVVKNWRLEKQTINGRVDLSVIGREQKAKEADQQAKAEIERLRGVALDCEGRIKRVIAEVMQEPEPSGEEGILAELKKMRMWQRFQGVLDKSELLTEGMERVIEGCAGDRLAFKTLREEVPLYLVAVGKTNLVGAAMAAIDKAEHPLLSPTQAKAHDLLGELENLMSTIRFTIGTVRFELNIMDEHRLAAVGNG